MTDLERLMQGQRDELAAWDDMADVLPADWRQAHGFAASARGGALAISLRDLPAGMFNRVFGLGDAAAVTQEDVAWAEAAVPHHAPWLQPTPGPTEADSFTLLRSLGYEQRPMRWAKLARSLAEPVDIPANDKVRVREAAADEGALFGRTLQEAYGLPPWMQDWSARLAGRPGWHLYFADDTRGRTIGCAVLFMNGASAWLGMAATFTTARNQGAQRSLMWRRLHDARALGATLATTETGEPMAGQPSPSFHNMLGCGFEVCGYRTNWSKPKA